jgi:membrane protein
VLSNAGRRFELAVGRFPGLAFPRDVIRAVDEQNLLMAAGGLAFFALLSGTPLLLAVVSIYGLVADPSVVEAEVLYLAGILPDDARALVANQLYKVVALSGDQLGIGVVLSIVGGVWGGSKGTFFMFRALNLAYGETESRKTISLKLMALGFTLLMIFIVAIVLGLVAWLPALLGFIGLDEHAQSLIRLGRWPVVAALAILVLALLYRFGPDRHSPRFRWISPGSAVAVLGWLGCSYLFSVYVSHFGALNEVYGSLAAFVILMIWLYLSALLILLGAVIDAKMAPSRHARASGGRNRAPRARPVARRKTHRARIVERPMDSPRQP